MLKEAQTGSTVKLKLQLQLRICSDILVDELNKIRSHELFSRVLQATEKSKWD